MPIVILRRDDEESKAYAFSLVGPLGSSLRCTALRMTDRLIFVNHYQVDKPPLVCHSRQSAMKVCLMRIKKAMLVGPFTLENLLHRAFQNHFALPRPFD